MVWIIQVELTYTIVVALIALPYEMVSVVIVNVHAKGTRTFICVEHNEYWNNYTLTERY